MKSFSRIIAYVLIALTVFALYAPVGTSAVAPVAATHETTAKAAALLEVGTGSVLYASAENERLPMASTTKVMTALLAVESGRLSEVVTVDPLAYGVEGSSIYLCLGERISLLDLTYGLMLRSGNDAAVAIAIFLGGSISGFCDMMNARAKKLGATDTHFSNPHGLPAQGHYTSAYDLARICAHAMKNSVFSEIVGTKYYTTTGEVTRSMMNKNKLLWNYEGALGIKTGYTIAAGKCLTFCAQRDGMTVVGVLLNCPDMFDEAVSLLNYVYSEFELYEMIKNGTEVMRVFVPGTNGVLLPVCTQGSAFIPVKKDLGISVKTQIEIMDGISAPIYAGQRIGTLTLIPHNENDMQSSLDNSSSYFYQIPLIAKHDIRPASFFYYLRIILGGI